jgi:hypothetical protein
MLDQGSINDACQVTSSLVAAGSNQVSRAHGHHGLIGKGVVIDLTVLWLLLPPCVCCRHCLRTQTHLASLPYLGALTCRSLHVRWRQSSRRRQSASGGCSDGRDSVENGNVPGSPPGQVCPEGATHRSRELRALQVEAEQQEKANAACTEVQCCENIHTMATCLASLSCPGVLNCKSLQAAQMQSSRHKVDYCPC